MRSCAAALQVPGRLKAEGVCSSNMMSPNRRGVHSCLSLGWDSERLYVILILTKLYDYNLGSITESSLWRSTDYGTTYEKLNDKVGLKTILSYLYVCPTNKRKIMLLTDPEVESSLLISSDEGATYQKYRLNFYIHSLLFHPKQEDWILAYSQDQKLFSSVEFGRRWLLLHEGVTPNRFYWFMTVGRICTQDLKCIVFVLFLSDAQYITCKMQNCSEATRSKPFPGYIDHNSLIVQGDYVFVQLTSGGRPHYYVSYRRSPFAQMKLPKYSLPKDMHVISTDENQVFAAVQEWNQNDTYNLYISDTRGVYFTLALENVKSSQGLEGNVMIDLYEVAGIKGMFLANKKIDNQVKTFITYNKGRDWSLLQAPHTDLRGNPIHCLLPYCSLHLHLKVSDNPYTSGNIASRDTAPSIIVASGMKHLKIALFDVQAWINSGVCGGCWIFEEEHSVLYLDQGGVLVAMKHTSLPIRHLWLSFDEGRSWSKYSFTSLPLFVDGVLGEPGEETLIMTVFGHFSHRSEWQLVKVDYKSIFDRRCEEEDYRPWQLHSQGEACIMGAKRIYRKRKSEKKCMQGKYAGAMTSEPCVCTEADFDCDYGYERHSNGQCLPAFWYNPSSLSKDCSLGQSYLNSTGYRKVVSNNCTDGVRERYTAKPQQCPGKPPQGLRILTADGRLTAQQGHNVTFLVQLEEVDFGDGIAVSYANLSSTEDGIKHIYQNVGIFRVTVLVENSLGSDSAVLYLHVTCPLEHVHLSLPFVTTKNKEINATAVLWPSQVGTLTYVWWFGNNTEPLITLEGSITFTFSVEGMNTITVQVSAGNTILQDTKTIAVYEKFQSMRLSFSPNLDDYNPDIPEWRRDISRVVKRALVEATGISSKHVLVAVLPGLPTSAELFILPYQDATGEKKRTAANLEQISETLIQKLNQNLVHFELKPGVRILVHAAHLTAAPLVDLTPSHSGSAMLMLLSVVFVGLAVFIIYKFKSFATGNLLTLPSPSLPCDEREGNNFRLFLSPSCST
uniref:Sortilin related VPS10 domain containing receptor 1 n=1 Tax=Junco hyemalis TaxID=40217 RepID=A0A8C5IYI2_JUNHY